MEHTHLITLRLCLQVCGSSLLLLGSKSAAHPMRAPHAPHSLELVSLVHLLETLPRHPLPLDLHSEGPFHINSSPSRGQLEPQPHLCNNPTSFIPRHPETVTGKTVLIITVTSGLTEHLEVTYCTNKCLRNKRMPCLCPSTPCTLCSPGLGHHPFWGAVPFPRLRTWALEPHCLGLSLGSNRRIRQVCDLGQVT